MHIVYLSLGSNLGDKIANINRAETLIDKFVGNILARSSVYATKPWGFESPNDFANTVIKVATQLQPQALLKITQDIERDMGRTTKSTNGHYHDRIIDIDIILYDNITIHEKNLQIPHPLMFERNFVMTPLREIMDSDEKELLKQILANTFEHHGN